MEHRRARYSKCVLVPSLFSLFTDTSGLKSTAHRHATSKAVGAVDDRADRGRRLVQAVRIHPPHSLSPSADLTHFSYRVNSALDPETGLLRNGAAMHMTLASRMREKGYIGAPSQAYEELCGQLQS